MADTNKKEQVYKEIQELVKKYNESAEFAEFKKMKKLEKDISEKVDDYNGLAWDDVASELAKADNPLIEAAKMLRYKIVRVHDVKEDGKTTRVVDDAMKPIDPLALHRKVDGGVGADKNWAMLMRKLNLLLTCRRGIELGLDANEIINTYEMSEQASKMDGFVFDVGKYDKNKADDLLQQDLQRVINAMFGEGYTVTAPMVQYLLMVYTRKGTRKALSVVTSNDKALATHMLDLGHAAITGNAFSLVYQMKK